MIKLELNDNYYSTDTMEEIPVNNISLREHLERLDRIKQNKFMVTCLSCKFVYLPMSVESKVRCVKCRELI